MARAPGLLDDRLDGVAALARETFAARVFIACLSATLVGLNMGVRTGGLWFAGWTLSEVWTWLAVRPMAGGRAGTAAQRIAFIGSMIASGAAWSSIAVLYWMTPSEALHLVGMAALAGVMIHAQCFCFRSPVALLVLAAPPAVLWIALPIVLGGYSGVPLITLAVSMTLVLVYVGASAVGNMRAAAALEAAQAEAVAANEAKSAFLAMMSHELRTPMNGVLGMAHALKLTQLDERQASHVDMLIRSGDGLMTILNDILDISKIEAGKLALEAVAFDLTDLGRRAAMLWNEAAAEKGVSLVYEVDDDTPAWVMGDPTRVRQILLNLLSNALKFTDTGHVRLSLRPAPSADGDGGVEIEVADTGIGMTEAQQAGLFRVFSQAETSTARRFGGTGLGLAICRQLASLMGGAIAVESRPGHGSTFRVWLPLPNAAPEQRTADAPAAGLAGLRILLAEDNPINQAVARAILEAAGASIQAVGNGAEALERLRAEAFDLVLMDVHMPTMDGIEAVQRLRAGQAGPADLPVIALTADAMAGEAARLKRLGFDALQPKPIQPGALLAAIVEVVERRAAARPAIISAA